MRSEARIEVWQSGKIGLKVDEISGMQRQYREVADRDRESDLSVKVD